MAAATAEAVSAKNKPLSAAEVIEQAKLDADGFHSRSEIKQVEVDSLRVDRSYQRDISQKIVEDIAGDWNEVASELILVSYRGKDQKTGGFWVINGQHRTMAAKRLGHKKIWARVVKLDDLEDPGLVEADLRLRTNARLMDRSPDRFKALLRAGDPSAVAIEKILKRFGTFINFTPRTDNNGLNSVASVEFIYEQDTTGSLLRDTLDTVKKAYGDINAERAKADVLKAVAWFLQKHDLEANKDRIIEALRTLGPAALRMRANMRKGSEGGSTWWNVYSVLVDLYNDGLPRKERLAATRRGIGATGRHGAE